MTGSSVGAAAPRKGWGVRAQIWLGAAVALGTIYLAARAVDFRQLLLALQEVRLPFVLMALCTALATNALKAARWRALFHPRPPRLSLLQLTNLIVVGQAVNFYIPARLGELVRAYLAGEEAGISKIYALGTIAAEKLIDIIVLALLIAAMLPFLALPDWLAGRIGPLFLTALVVCMVIVALIGGRRLIWRPIAWGLHLLPAAWGERWQTRIRAGLDGLSALGSL
ncbi:MAG: flippase-like domain-containing protein, partial [Anaerolineae bacterium]|nr:flippase-like domain-containing protein [Anaerolineae bacterium]